MSSFEELARGDPRLRQLRLVLAIFVIAPLGFAALEHPERWLDAYANAMLYGFSAPCALLVVLLVVRRRRLRQVAERGVQVDATIERTWQNRDGRFARVRFRLHDVPHDAEIRIPDAVYAGANQRVLLLVDPLKPRNAVLLSQRLTDRFTPARPDNERT